MRVYGETASPWRCGYWNGSPIEVALTTDVMTRVPAGEANHYHDFHEYYVVLHGRATLRVEGKDVPLEAGIVVMVQPEERHRVTWIDPDVGADGSSSRSDRRRMARSSFRSRTMDRRPMHKRFQPLAAAH